MTLSIIIPYYDAEPYTSELLNVLAPQMNEHVECLLIDDGSDEPFTTTHGWVKVIRKENGGPATARNLGIDKAQGEYLSFIDADDLVSEYYVDKLISAIERTHADIIDLSWKSFDKKGAQHNYMLRSEHDRLTNPSVCTRCFKRSFIGDNRLNELKDATEDEDFSRKLGYLEPGNYTHSAITDYMYFYRTSVPGSNVKNFKRGLTKTKRIIYYYPNVTSEMGWLVDEIKKDDEVNEVLLLTNYCAFPELKRYCTIMKPGGSVWGHYLKGERYNRFIKMEIPTKAQVIIYCEFVDMVGGIASFIYNTCQHLKDDYDILVLYDRYDSKQCERLRKIVRVMKNDPEKSVACDTIILNRVTDKIPSNVIYKKSILVCHACNQKMITLSPNNADYLVNVSQTAKDSWGETANNSTVIHNMSYPNAKELLLVSATRMCASDKGKNEHRIRTLAKMLNEKRIPFVWLNFSDKALPNPPENFINMGAMANIQSFIKRADYLVQLSDVEAYSMSILEALTLNTPVLATPFPSLFEEGFEDGVHGYVIPYDMKFDVEKILNIPKFSFEYDNASIKSQWKELLGAPAPKREVAVKEAPMHISVNVVKEFRDKYTGKLIRRGPTLLPEYRVREILNVQKENHVKLIEVAEAI